MSGRREEEGRWIRQLRSQHLKSLNDQLDSFATDDESERIMEFCDALVNAVIAEDGGLVLINYLTRKASEDANFPAAVLLNSFIAKCEGSLSNQANLILPGLLNLYTSSNPQIVDLTIDAADSLTKCMNQRELVGVMPVVHSMIDNIVVAAAGKGQQIPGFQRAKGLRPLGLILQNSIVSKKEMEMGMAAQTLGTIVKIAEVCTLQDVFMSIIIPLIQIYKIDLQANLKVIILSSMSTVLDKLSMSLHPFLPQLQSTFLNALHDQSRPVRLAAGGGLVRLVKIHQNPEVMMTELLQFLEGSTDQQLIESSLATARALIAACPDEMMSQSTIEKIYHVTEQILSETVENPSEIDDSVPAYSAALLGETIKKNDLWTDAISLLQDIKSPKPRLRQGMGYLLQQLCSNADIWPDDLKEYIYAAGLQSAFQSTDPIVVSSALRAASFILKSSYDPKIFSTVIQFIKHEDADIRRTTVVAVGHMFYGTEWPNDVLKLIVPQLIKGCYGCNDRVLAVRSASQLALVHALKMTENEVRFKECREALDENDQRYLDATRAILVTRIQSGNIELEPLDTIQKVD